MEAFIEAISPRTKLITMTQIPSTAGGMIPVVEIGKIARKTIFYTWWMPARAQGRYP